MSDKDEVIAKAGIVAVELDTLADVMADLVAKFNEKVEEANGLIDDLNEDVEEDDYVEPDYLIGSTCQTTTPPTSGTSCA